MHALADGFCFSGLRLSWHNTVGKREWVTQPPSKAGGVVTSQVHMPDRTLTPISLLLILPSTFWQMYVFFLIPLNFQLLERPLETPPRGDAALPWCPGLRVLKTSRPPAKPHS